MWFLFRGCSSLRTVDVSSFDTSNVNGMSYMFGGVPHSCRSMSPGSIPLRLRVHLPSLGCSSLKQLDLSSFDMSAAQYMNSFFQRLRFSTGGPSSATALFSSATIHSCPTSTPRMSPSWRNEKGQIFAASESPAYGRYVCLCQRQTEHCGTLKLSTSADTPR